MDKKRIFVNALYAKGGGGKSILINFLASINKNSAYEFHVFVPDKAEYQFFASDHVIILKIPKIYNKTELFPIVNQFILPWLVRRQKCDLVFNLANAPMPTSVRQVFLFQWSYAAFPRSPVWQMMDFKSWLVRKAKLYFFRKNIKHVDQMIAQTPVMKERLESLYNIRDVEVVPNAVSLNNTRPKDQLTINLGSGLNLLYLAVYYPHKNFEIFLPLAQEIKSCGENIRIITTISADQHPKAAQFLKQVEQQGLEDVIQNIGPVAMRDVPSVYMQTDGLLMPTLLESFSGTYVEAMFHGKPIFTSNLPFATGVCKDVAYYFDPLDPLQILETILESQRDLVGRDGRIQAGKQVLAELMTWEQAFNAYLRLFDKVLLAEPRR